MTSSHRVDNVTPVQPTPPVAPPTTQLRNPDALDNKAQIHAHLRQLERGDVGDGHEPPPDGYEA